MKPTPESDARLAAAPCRLIAGHGVIGDLRTGALVDADGTIDWFCCPTFDAPTVFGAAVDGVQGGHFRIAGEGWTRQQYVPDTNVLVTRFFSKGGIGETHDFMPMTGDQCLIRRVSCVRGRMRFTLECDPRFDHGRDRHATAVGAGGAWFRSPAISLTLHTRVPLERTRTGGVGAAFMLGVGEASTSVLTEGALGPARPSEVDTKALLDQTVAYWRAWIGRSRYTDPWREIGNRSALTLELLTPRCGPDYARSGGVVRA
jgi:GH15 family glucan-1,4-alpha-glucosidase